MKEIFSFIKIIPQLLDVSVKWFSLSNLLLYSVSAHSKYHLLVISSKTANKKTPNKLSMWKGNKSVFVIIYSAVPLNSKGEIVCYFIIMILKILFYNDEKINGGIMKLNVVISILM